MKNVVIVLVLCFLTLMGSYFIDQSSPLQVSLNQQTMSQDQDFLPSFSSLKLNGKAFSSDVLSGHVSLVHFWATWCPPCVVELPALIKFARENPDIKVTAISTDFSQDKVEAFFAQKIEQEVPENFVVLLDIKGDVTRGVFGVSKLPETILVSSKSEIVRWYKGDVDWGDPLIRRQVSSVQ